MSEKILNEAKQPYGYLIEAMKKRDTELTKLKLIQKDLSNQLNKTRREKSKICEEKNRMASDLEKLLSQKTEFLKLRRIVEELRDGHQSPNGVLVEKPRLGKDPINTFSQPPHISKGRNQEYAISRS